MILESVERFWKGFDTEDSSSCCESGDEGYEERSLEHDLKKYST